MTFLYIIISLLCLNFIIFFHELFHLTAAKLLRIKTTEFSVGVGPSLIGIQKKNGKVKIAFFSSKEDGKLDPDSMTYHIRAIPLGGYVSFGKVTKIDTPIDKTKPAKSKFSKLFSIRPDTQYETIDYLFAEKPWKRIIVALAGPIGNFLLAIILAILLLAPFVSFGNTTIEVKDVENGSYAEELGLQSGDKILRVNDMKLDNMQDFDSALQLQSESLCVTWENKSIHSSCTKVNQSKQDLKLGVLVSDGLSISKLVPTSVTYVYELAKDYSKQFIDTIFGLKVENLSGPVGAVDAMQKTVPEPLIFLNILILVNIALGIANLLFPFSITDGGRIIIDLFAILFRKHKLPTIYLDIISIFLMLVLMSFTTYMDIIRIF